MDGAIRCPLHLLIAERFGGKQKGNIMAYRQMHLDKNSGSGMASRTACGRNILRTPMSTNWTGFKAEPIATRCVKCAGSTLFAFLTRKEATL